MVVDVGTSSVRGSVVRPDGTVDTVARRPLPPSVPAAGLVEIDATALASAVLDVARAALERSGPVEGVGVTAQRASVIAWDGVTGKALGPGIGWQDLRTAGTCLELQSEGIRLSPSESATKAAWLLDTYAPDRGADVRIGTVDTWVTWCLSEGSAHITDPTNAAVTGLFDPVGRRWKTTLAARLGIPETSLAAIVDSSGRAAEASALAGSPPICGIVGDQQASLIGQGCTRPGQAKATFGTGAMLDLCTGADQPDFGDRGRGGCFPIVAWSRAGRLTWGVEAIMLTAGSAVDWLVEDLGVLTHAGQSEEVAARCDDAGGVMVVPAFLGLATPTWDFGARATVVGLTRGSGRPELVRAVLEGVAHQGADLLEAAERDAGVSVTTLRVDGGMTANTVFLQALADTCARPIEVSAELEATTLGAGYLSGMAVGLWADEDEIADSWSPRMVVEPSARTADRHRWRRAVDDAKSWYPELTALEF
ncbi:MAG: FGGY-family carbohydrate kinase [Actinomycetota bacterium]|nr:FGGY-family carbohydrate kinase [Actinomycetota bacterium]